jgi:hypothetical protein
MKLAIAFLIASLAACVAPDDRNSWHPPAPTPAVSMSAPSAAPTTTESPSTSATQGDRRPDELDARIPEHARWIVDSAKLHEDPFLNVGVHETDWFTLANGVTAYVQAEASSVSAPVLLTIQVHRVDWMFAEAAYAPGGRKLTCEVLDRSVTSYGVSECILIELPGDFIFSESPLIRVYGQRDKFDVEFPGALLPTIVERLRALAARSS